MWTFSILNVKFESFCVSDEGFSSDIIKIVIFTEVSVPSVHLRLDLVK